ncbi:MAG: hypothetical protein LBM96_04325 [Methanobrevibacter sp.]|jgi:uncharacterized protein YehS (DUF1456 family)|nr:hypothetical protein [Candidatus Methanoflexus mossambicus]
MMIKKGKKDDLNYDHLKKEILEYYQKCDDIYMSEVADALKLDSELVIKITKDLINERKVKEV